MLPMIHAPITHMISNADYALIATPARTVSDVMPREPGEKEGAGLQRLIEGESTRRPAPG
jgi:hypothetical protein